MQARIIVLIYFALITAVTKQYLPYFKIKLFCSRPSLIFSVFFRTSLAFQGLFVYFRPLSNYRPSSQYPKPSRKDMDEKMVIIHATCTLVFWIK